MFAFKNKDLSLNIAIILAILSPSVIFVQAFLSKSPQAAFAVSSDKDPIAERIRPVVTLDDIVKKDGDAQTDSSPAMAVAKTPEALYQGACLACHASGVANAPKLGDKAAWEPRAAQGMDSLLHTAISGKGAMPPKGGSAYSDEELTSVIEYMLSEAGLSATN